MTIEDLNETQEIDELTQLQIEFNHLNLPNELQSIGQSLLQESQLHLEDLRENKLETETFIDCFSNWISEITSELSLYKEDFKGYPIFQTASNMIQECKGLFNLMIENEKIGDQLLNLIGLGLTFVDKVIYYLEEGHLVDDLLMVGSKIEQRLQEYTLQTV